MNHPDSESTPIRFNLLDILVILAVVHLLGVLKPHWNDADGTWSSILIPFSLRVAATWIAFLSSWFLLRLKRDKADSRFLLREAPLGLLLAGMALNVMGARFIRWELGDAHTAFTIPLLYAAFYSLGPWLIVLGLGVQLNKIRVPIRPVLLVAAGLLAVLGSHQFAYNALVFASLNEIPVEFLHVPAERWLETLQGLALLQRGDLIGAFFAMCVCRFRPDLKGPVPQ